MPDFLVRLVNKVKSNPIGAGAFTLALTCLGFWFNTEIHYADNNEKIEKNYIEISELNKDLNNAGSLIVTWADALIRNDSSARLLQTFLKSGSILTKEDIGRVVEIFSDSRQSLNKILVQTSVSRSENKILSGIYSDIHADASYLDGYIKEVLESILSTVENPKTNNKNIQQVTPLIERYRKFEEIDARLVTINDSYEKVNDLHNSLVRIDRQQRDRMKFESRIVVACWAYIGGYIGFWIGFFIRRYRRRMRKEVPVPEHSTPPTNITM